MIIICIRVVVKCHQDERTDDPYLKSVFSDCLSFK